MLNTSHAQHNDLPTSHGSESGMAPSSRAPARTEPPSKAEKEQAIRTSIARKESVCPYAPGLARFVHLPSLTSNSEQHLVGELADALHAFYEAKEKGKRVGRWMLMPEQEWRTHEEAHAYGEQLFWLLNAAYYRLSGDKRRERAALKRKLSGYNRGHQNEILNPVIGDLPQRDKPVPVRSLFYTALSPLYRSRRFYRYSPYCLIPLVYAEEFHALTVKHPKVSEKVTFEMAHGGLYESFGDSLDLDLVALRKELALWGAIMDRSAAILRANKTGTSSFSPQVQGCPATNLLRFRDSQPKLINALASRYMAHLPQLASVMEQSGENAKNVIGAAFAGSGLYVTPFYGKRSLLQ